MQGLMGLLSIFDGSSYSANGLFGSSTTGGSVPLIIILAVIGGSYINSMTGTPLSGFGGFHIKHADRRFVAIWLAGNVRQPIDSDALAAAIIGLAGMTVTGLMLVFPTSAAITEPSRPPFHPLTV